MSRRALKGEPLARETAFKTDEKRFSLCPITILQLLGFRYRRYSAIISLANRFNKEGSIAEPLLNADGKAAWWASVWFIRAVAWFSD